MTRSLRAALRKQTREGLRAAFGLLPRQTRFSIYRRMIDCDPAPDPRLQVHIADTRDDLEACFALLHDAYVASGFMKPDPSGLRVTIYHALPTTTTLAATFDGEVVGTMSMIREGVFGFPLQSVFDLSALRAQPGHIAEISALAVAPAFRRTGGAVLFPMMKFMYAYCTRFFDTRHLVIAVNPNKSELYESLLFFRRLQASAVDNYDFANGAPAVGATLDLHSAPDRFVAVYGKRRPRKNLHHYFVDLQLPNLRLPGRRYFTTNDPVMTPALLDHFFNQRTRVFDSLDERQRVLLHAIYGDGENVGVLPSLAPGELAGHPVRRHPRHSIKFPATLTLNGSAHALMVIELSLHGFQGLTAGPLTPGASGRLQVQLGQGLQSTVDAQVVRQVSSADGCYFGFRIDAPDSAWIRCVESLEGSLTHAELAAPAPVRPGPARSVPAAQP